MALLPAELAPADVLLAAEPAALVAFLPAELAPADVLLAPLDPLWPAEPAALVAFFWLVVVLSALSP